MSTHPPEKNDALAIFAPPEGADTGPVMTVSTRIARIGQGSQNEIVLDDDTVSTNHARLEYTDEGWRLTDLESRNGTYIEGVRLAAGVPTPLPENALVGFGAVKLQFQGQEELDASLISAREPAAAASAGRRPTGIRIPVWLVVLVVLFLALLVFLFVWFGGGPAPSEPVTEPTTAQLQLQAFRYAA